ncbi:MAG: peptide deformylase [Alphaproteobacteria bacterium]|nr:peptide deformylase [Alphaproteobacteria bacterium]
MSGRVVCSLAFDSFLYKKSEECDRVVFEKEAINMDLKIYPDSVLSKKCEDVEIGDSNVLPILNEMSQKLYDWNGVGLAAPQVGVLKKLVVIDVRDDPAVLFKMINPRIVWTSEDRVESEEGCLSLPNLIETVQRFSRVTVEYFDENFDKQQVNACGLLSRCLQHELDHLQGMLYVDRLSRLKRSLALKRFKKSQEKNFLTEKEA